MVAASGKYCALGLSLQASGVDGFAECIARDINAHFVAAYPFACAAKRAGVNADFKGTGFENFEIGNRSSWMCQTSLR